MGGFEDNIGGIMGDWMAPSPSPRSFFSAMLTEAGSRSVSEPPNHDHNNLTSGFTFHGPNRQFGSETSEPVTKPASSRSGLVDRMAARTGFNAPRLNTDIIRPSVDVEKQSPYLTIPPGLSPTSLLDSPVFLSNSQVQPSPTTGKFPFAANGRTAMMFSESSDTNKDNIFQDFNGSSFAFKPVPESAPISREVNPTFTTWQSENRFISQTTKTAQNENVNRNIVQEHREEDATETGPTLIQNRDDGNNDDGYNWRKYGQKQVKGSEYPRSYYKCTNPNCPVKKKVERSHEGHITEIIYKGAHSHPKPPPGRRSGIGSSGDVQGQDGNYLEVTSSTVDGSLTFSNDEEGEDDRVTHGSVSLGGDGEEDESESKRRKVEAYAADVSGASRAIREPRVVVQTTSEVDILDDGYRWRKYGQKVVKGNPNPRSYYKCTSNGCTVRKLVERASHDLKSVITTYEGKHNHDVPVARNTSHINNSQAQIQNNIAARIETPNYGLQPGPHGYGYGMNMAQRAMAWLGPNQYLGQMMVHNGEPKVEPVSDPGLNLVNGSSGYHHQMTNRLRLDP